MSKDEEKDQPQEGDGDQNDTSSKDEQDQEWHMMPNLRDDTNHRALSARIPNSNDEKK